MNFLVRSLALAALSLSFARSAGASVVVTKAGGDVHVSDVRLAHATSATRTVTWEQLVLDEARGELAWVIPVPRGGWIEPADDRWFEALDAGTAAVIAPHKTLECAPTISESTANYGTVSYPRVVSAGFPGLAPAAAIDKLNSLGFVITPTLRATILGLESLKEDVAVLTLPAGTRGVTKVVRVLGPSGRAVPMMLMPTGGALPRLTAYTFAEGRAKFAGLPAFEVDRKLLSWSSGRSNYRSLLDDTIIKASPGVAITFSGLDGVFTDQAAGTTGTTIPSIAQRYFGAASECVARVSALSTSSKPVAATCAKSSPWSAGATAPGCAVSTGEELSAASLSCGALDDLAVAAGGLSPSRLVVTRLDGVANSFTSGLPLELSALGTVSSFHEAKLGPLCTAGGSTTQPPQQTPGTSTGEPPPSGEGSSGEGSSYSSSSSGDGCSATAQVFADGCARSSSSSDSDGCSGDSSSSDSDGCSSDSSSSSDGCSGASDSADDGCSSSSSSSSSSGCSGASSSADDGCRASRVRPRVRFSAGVYALIAALAIARRFTRRNQYDRALQGTCPRKTSTDVPARE